MSIITSILSIGIQDVWDIEVENDHSYVAQGRTKGDKNA